ncbi:MAG TPA: hypothetical protein PKI69_07795 [Rhodocyclaceae bacterium]|nr:hypothetical protein [Rhodocyclaceae bacterium]
MQLTYIRPQGRLAEVVAGYLFASTLDESWPTDMPWLSSIPAGNEWALTVFTEGRAVLLGDGLAPPQVLPSWVLSGPRMRPVTLMNLCPLRAVSVLFHGDALARLVNLAPVHLPQGCVDPAELLGADWALFRSALGARAGDRVAQQNWLEAFLEPRWEARRLGLSRAPTATVRAAGRIAAAASARAMGWHERCIERSGPRAIAVTPAVGRHVALIHGALMEAWGLGPAAGARRLGDMARALGVTHPAGLVRALAARTWVGSERETSAESASPPEGLRSPVRPAG